MGEISYSGGLSVSEVKDMVKAAKIYKLSSNESPLEPSPQVLTAIQETAVSLNEYPARDDGRLRAALADFHGRGLTEQHFAATVGGVELIDLLARIFLMPGDEAIVCPPTFGWYVSTIQRQGAIPVSVPLDAYRFNHDVGAILAAVTERTRLVYICNPHNPTGAMLTAGEMARLVHELPPHVVIIADEVYHHFVQRADYPDSLAHALNGSSVIIIHSFSKAYGLAGLRLGYAIARPDLIQQIVARKRPFHHSSLILAAGIAALQDQEHLYQTVAIVNEGKQYWYQQLAALDVAYWPSEANFVLIRPSGDVEQVYNQLLERGIMTRPTSKSGLPGYLRVTVGLPEANQAFIAALADILNR
jgi:histidinol-phosphate aminotransferase